MSISQPDLIREIPNLNPKVLRFPSGGAANWWDWKTGWFIDDPDVPQTHPNLTPVDNTLEKFKIMVDTTGATPMFVLNMISSNLQYQLGMLKHADSIGLPVRYVELGEEFYLAEESDSTLIYSVFPTAESYGTVASKWIDSIHYYFPNALVAAQGAFNRNSDTRRLTWDTSVVKTLEGEDVISFHEYFNSSSTEAQGEGDGVYTPSDIKEFMYRPFKAWNILRTEDLPTVRPGREVWITEYNLQDTHIPVHGSWGHGLFVATQSMLFLESPLITRLYFHTACGSAGYGAYFTDNKGFLFDEDGMFIEPANPPITDPWSFTAAGRGVQLFSEAVDGMKYASPLTFDGIPSIPFLDKEDTVSYPAVYGWQFSNDNGSSALIVNVSANEYKIKTTAVFPSGGTYTRYTSDPLDYVSSDTGVNHKSDELGSTLSLKAYSITQIQSNAVPLPPPSVTIKALTPTVVCVGDSVHLDAGKNYLNYLWSTGETSRKIFVKNTGNYWVKVWTAENGYYAIDTMSVTVNPLPIAPVIKISGDAELCQGESVTLSVKTIKDGISYQWSTGAWGNTLNVSAAGSYVLTAVDQNSCTANSGERVDHRQSFATTCDNSEWSH
jgi:hypothetical protein